MKNTRIVLLSAAALAATVGLGSAAAIGFGSAAAISVRPAAAGGPDPRQGPQLVQLAIVKPAGASERAFTGVISARVQSNLGFRVPGKVIERLVDVGQNVRAGQPLMRLDQKDLELALSAKTSAVAAARAVAVQATADEARRATASSSPLVGRRGRNTNRPGPPSTARTRSWRQPKHRPMSRETKLRIRCCAPKPTGPSSRPWPNPGRSSPPVRSS